MANQYLPSQFSGPLIQELLDVIVQEQENEQFIIDYLNDLSIDTAWYTELQSIGYLIGYPWPTIPSGIFGDNILTFGSEASYPTHSPHGFGSVSGTGSGIWASASPSSTSRVSIQTYRQLLPAVAYLKYNGLSIKSIDQIANIFLPSGLSYTISYENNPNYDIALTYSGEVGAGNLFILQAIFERYCTDVQVTVGEV